MAVFFFQRFKEGWFGELGGGEGEWIVIRVLRR